MTLIFSLTMKENKGFISFQCKVAIRKSKMGPVLDFPVTKYNFIMKQKYCQWLNTFKLMQYSKLCQKQLKGFKFEFEEISLFKFWIFCPKFDIDDLIW